MNVNDGTEPCPTCHNAVPYNTLKLHAEINRLRQRIARVENAYHTYRDYIVPLLPFPGTTKDLLDAIGSALSESEAKE